MKWRFDRIQRLRPLLILMPLLAAVLIAAALASLAIVFGDEYATKIGQGAPAVTGAPRPNLHRQS
jgi:hypothetical protein